MIAPYLVPICLVLAIWLIVPRSWMAGPRMRALPLQIVFLLVVAVVGRYLAWRFTATLPKPEASSSELVFYWSIFVIEMLIWIDTAILLLMLSRPRDNRGEADEGELRLRAATAADLPAVDIFIATYNEDLSVLEKTILGAKAIDWPAERVRVCVLDDGKRDWLASYCLVHGVDYFTRESNAHAKAGNINEAIARTDGEFFMVLDADFVPQRNFLYRAMGLFADPKVGIVQVPHSFYNADPMQANLRLRKVMPDDQRLFFGNIMPGRDGWNAAFCCGSNSITRRSAMEAIGNKLPTGSITEDMLLTLALLRKGFVTRYLNERLAIGLAPESLSAMYVQRARWARGAIQILFLREGPFGPGLRVHERIMFTPLHWLAQSLVVVSTLLTPAICLWTNWSPLPGADTADILFYQVPAVLALVLCLRLAAPEGFFVISTMVHNCLQAPRILPTVLTTLLKPQGHVFKVTPKGEAARGNAFDRIMIFLPAFVIATTAAGIWINADINTRILASSAQLPLLSIWAIFSMIVLTIVQAVAISPTGLGRDETFPIGESCEVNERGFAAFECTLERLSLSVARIEISSDEILSREATWVRLKIPNVGAVAGFITSRWKKHADIAIYIQSEAQREELIRYLFTMGRNNSSPTVNADRILGALILRAVGWKRRISEHRNLPEKPPERLLSDMKDE